MNASQQQELILLCAFPGIDVPMTKPRLRQRMEHVARVLFGDAKAVQYPGHGRALIDAVCRHYIEEDVSHVFLVENGANQRAFMLDLWKDEYGAEEIPSFAMPEEDTDIVPARDNVVPLFPPRPQRG